MKNLKTIRSEFPIFRHNPDLVYLDSAATSLKPQSVIDAVAGYYERYSANVGRGLYPIAEKATEKVDETREKIASFLGGNRDEIIFVRGATEGINLLASTLSTFLESGDNIVVTEMEHHSNYLPWKRISDERSVEFRMIPVGADGNIDPASLATVIDTDTAIVSFSAVSNVLGTRVSVADIIRRMKSIAPDAAVVVDASQVVGHSKIDVTEWGADFVVFSGHKMFGPTGVGIVWGRKHLLDTLSPYELGGGMVGDACADEPAWKDAPYRFEAGTPDIAAIIGLGAAVDFIADIGIGNIEEHEKELAQYAMKRLTETFGDDVIIFGSKDPSEHPGPISFTLEGVHPHDLAQILGEHNICVRAGEHCAAPLHRALDIPASARISFSVYTERQDIDRLIDGLLAARRFFGKEKSA